MMKINGKEIANKKFAFDGCHKIYLLEENVDTKQITDCGYDLEKDVFDISKLPEIFWNTCPLRFIENWKDFVHIVPQCESVVVFETDTEIITENFSEDKIERVAK